MGIELGRLRVRRSVLIDAAPAVVWGHFETFDRMSAWFGIGHTLERFEPAVGGRVELSVEIGGERRPFGGAVLVWETGRELTFEDNWFVDPWPLPTFITIRLAPVFEGTHVELFHHGFERLGATAAAEHLGYEDGLTPFQVVRSSPSGSLRIPLRTIGRVAWHHWENRHVPTDHIADAHPDRGLRHHV
jgi:uncharacterized protein YndB with AHSA1/START domain